jgi:hypothetical protein
MLLDNRRGLVKLEGASVVVGPQGEDAELLSGPADPLHASGDISAEFSSVQALLRPWLES